MRYSHTLNNIEL